MKWNFINEVRNSARTKINMYYLRRSFDELESDQKRISEVLNYRFSKLGVYLGAKKTDCKSNFDPEIDSKIPFGLLYSLVKNL